MSSAPIVRSGRMRTVDQSSAAAERRWERECPAAQGCRYVGTMLLLCRFEVSDESKTQFLDRAEHALRLLTTQDGCIDGELARATEKDESWVLVVRFDSVAAYRHAMSAFEVRESVIPLLSEARIEESAVHESAVTATDGDVRRHASMLAADADTVRPGTSGRAEPR